MLESTGSLHDRFLFWSGCTKSGTHPIQVLNFNWCSVTPKNQNETFLRKETHISWLDAWSTPAVGGFPGAWNRTYNQHIPIRFQPYDMQNNNEQHISVSIQCLLWRFDLILLWSWVGARNLPQGPNIPGSSRAQAGRYVASNHMPGRSLDDLSWAKSPSGMWKNVATARAVPVN